MPRGGVSDPLRDCEQASDSRVADGIVMVRAQVSARNAVVHELVADRLPWVVLAIKKLLQAVGLKQSTRPAPIDASANPTYSSGLMAAFGGWIAIDTSTLTIGAPPKTSGMT